MTTGVTSEFEASLRGLGMTWTRTDSGSFAATVDEAVAAPAVGTPLPFDGVSLDDTVVTQDPTPEELDAAETGVTPAEMGIADYGSVVLAPTAAGHEPVSLYPERHVAVLAASDVVPDMPTAFERMGEAFAAGRADAIIATGPSATADMGALVEGAHGPKEVHVVVLEDR
ncbi:LutC/YkgG family protein [Halomicrococcus gelatinilyticus]|uniref:LutC/YkgG family protein n=1 Tax=Halomicrococcus gelatinilyticus TaxID=1702103 RepID=UPI002E0FA38D